MFQTRRAHTNAACQCRVEDEQVRPRALLLDEREPFLALLTDVLETAGCSVAAAPSLLDVPAALQLGSPDLVLARVEFESGAGIHLAGVLRCRSRRAHIVAYATCMQSRAVGVAEDLGMADHFVDEAHLGHWLDVVLPHVVEAARADQLAVRASQHLRTACRPVVGDLREGMKLGAGLAAFETNLIRATLAVQPGQRAAARLLGLSESTLRARLKKLGIKSGR